MVDGDADADRQGWATLPHTGAGFPTGAARAFALFLLSVRGLPAAYGKGMLPVPRRRQGADWAGTS
jgi:hypothetical protein